MRPIFSALFVVFTVGSGSASALGLSVEFPTLTWPVTAPATSPELPTQEFLDPSRLFSILCPAPSR